MLHKILFIQNSDPGLFQNKTKTDIIPAFEAPLVLEPLFAK